MSRQRLVLLAWAWLVLGLAVRAFAAGVLPTPPSAVRWQRHCIDVNRADVDELSSLPGIGRTRAEAIVVDRIRNGPFRRLEDLSRVDGIGPHTVQGLRGIVQFAPQSAPP